MSKCRIHLEFIARANWNHLLFECEHTLVHHRLRLDDVMEKFRQSFNLWTITVLRPRRGTRQFILYDRMWTGGHIDTIQLYASNKE